MMIKGSTDLFFIGIYIHIANERLKEEMNRTHTAGN